MFHYICAVKPEKIYEAKISDEAIQCATLLNSNEVVLLLADGDVCSWNLNEGKARHLFSAIDSNGFDIGAPCAIYTMDQIVVIVNDRKTHGFAYNGKTGLMIPIHREDYHADVSSYPIAIYNDERGVPHLIYAVAWNHLQIMNLDTQVLLTANKTVIVAEARDKKFYEQHPQIESRMPWPRNLDYFYGQLSFSPDGKRFLSRGWDWGSSDDYEIFDLHHFIHHEHVLGDSFFGGEHTNRPICWIDDHRLATTYYPYRDENEPVKTTHVHIYEDVRNGVDPIKEFIIDDSDEVYGEMFYSREYGVLIQFEDGHGTWIYNLDGNIKWRDKSFTPTSFHPDLGLFLSIDDRAIMIHRLTQEAE